MHRLRFQKPVAAVLVTLAAGCTVDLSVDGRVMVTCRSDADCPEPLLCDGDRCVQPRDFGKVPPQPPTVAILSVGPTDGSRAVADVPFSVLLSDPNGPPVGNDAADLEVELALGTLESDPEVLTWFAATPGADGCSDLSAAPDGTLHALVWDAVADATAGTAGLTAIPVDTTGDGATDADVVASTDLYARLRITATDSSGAVSNPVVSAPFDIGNRPTTIAIDTPTHDGWLRGLVAVELILDDDDLDLSGVELEFDVGDGLWRKADVVAGASANLLPDPTTPYVLMWETRTPPNPTDPTLPQGVGIQAIDGVRLRARASDAPTSGEVHFGAWTAPLALLEIRNQTSPRVIDIRAVRSDYTAGGAPVRVYYRLIDNESDPIDLRFEFSRGVGEPWERCSELPEPLSEGRRDLISVPEDGTGGGGLDHVFAWDATNQLSLHDNTRLRIWATDGVSPSTATTVPLTYSVGPPDGSGAPFVLQDTVLLSASGENYWIASADFDGDGVLDLAAPTLLDNEVTVLLGNGDATFDAAGVYSTLDGGLGTWPQPIAAGEVTGDLAPDWVTGNLDGTVSVARGNGDGSFNAVAVWDGGGQIRDIAIVDIDGDEDNDILAVNDLQGASGSPPSSISMLRNNGSGSFAAPVPTAVGHGLYELAVADIDGDLDLDVATASVADESVWLLHNDGSGAFATSTVPIPDAPQYLTLADFDGDGDADLAVGTLGSGLYILHNDGTGSFDRVAHLVGGGESRSLEAGDFNRDGIPDVVAAQGSQDRVTLFLGTGTPGNPLGLFAPFLGVAAGNEPRALVIGDFDRDGWSDIATVNNLSGDVSILRRAPYGTPTGGLLSSAVTYEWGDGDELAIADINGDGAPDLAVPDRDDNALLLLGGHPVRGGAEGTFEPIGRLAALEGPFRALAADLDTVTVSIGNGDGTFAAAQSTGVGWTETVLVEDFDEDGICDLALGQGSGSAGEIHILLGGGTNGVWDGSFGAHAVYSLQGGSGVMQAIDLNDDDVLDIVAAHPFDLGSTGGFSFLRGRASSTGVGNGQFAAAVRMASGSTRGMAIGDVTGDGIADVITSIGGDPLQAHPAVESAGDWSGGFGAPVSFTSTTTGGITLGDMNGDGLLDVAQVVRLGAPVSVSLGQLTTTETWSRILQPWPDAGGRAWSWGSDVAVTGTDRFQEPIPLTTVGQHRIAVAGDARDWLEDCDLPLPDALLPMTRGWRVEGDLQLARVPDPELAGVASAGDRLLVQRRLGPDAGGVAGGRAGLDLGATQERGVVIEIPIRPARQVLLPFGNIELILAEIDWVRADEHVADPAYGMSEAHAYLPRVERTEWNDLILPTRRWHSIPPDDDDDLTTPNAEGPGPRFVIDTSLPAQPRILLLTDVLGEIQGFLTL